MGTTVREDTVTGLVQQLLRKKGLTAQGHPGLEMGSGHHKEPDLAIQNDGTYAYEAKWEDDYYKGIAQARDYGIAPTINGSTTVTVASAQFGNQSVPGEDFVVVVHETDDGEIGAKIGESAVLDGNQTTDNITVNLERESSLRLTRLHN